MNPEIKERWITALRSGNYGQVKGQLGVEIADQPDHSGYCCLGVLCEVAVEDGVVTREVVPSGTVEYVDENSGGHAWMVLSEAVTEWADIVENPEVNVEGLDIVIDDVLRTSASLAELNDYAGKDFNFIADVIETRL